MIIKSSKENRQSIYFMIVGMILWFILLWWETNNIEIAFFICCIPMVIVIRVWIGTDRVLIMNDQGCEVVFLCYKRFYQWDELKVKRIEDFSKAIGYKNIYKKGAIFSKKEVYKLKWIKPLEYMAFVRPWALICVNFLPDKEPRLGYKYPHMYAVNEKEFLSQLEIWNVKLDKSVD